MMVRLRRLGRVAREMQEMGRLWSTAHGLNPERMQALLLDLVPTGLPEILQRIVP